MGRSNYDTPESMKPRSPIEMMIDAACEHVPNAEPTPRKLTDQEKEMCSQLGRDVLADLRYAYPDVVKTRPTTWPLHLRNTISIKAEMMLREYLENVERTHRQ
jgi:hypothetical protein